jgi:hypothetical protein
MALPQTRIDFQHYCLRKLGAPVINIELHSTQVEDITDEALHYFKRNHSNGSELVYLPYKLTPAVIAAKSLTMPSDMVGVTKVFQVGYSSQALLTVDFQIASQAMYAALQGAGMANYQLMMSYRSMIQELASGQKPIRWTINKQVVYIDLNWSQVTPDSWVIIEGYKALDPAVETTMWHEPWFIDYTTALMKKQWGANLSKYTGVKLPGGIEMDGRTLFTDAVTDIENLLLRLKDEENLPPDMMVG